MMKFVAFDVETTGVKPASDHMIEIGAVMFDNGRAGERFGRLINPGVPIPMEASSINGITDDMVRDQPSVKDVLKEFAAFCGDLPLVAHNAPFDFKFVRAAVQLHKSPAPSGPVLDTLPLSRLVFPGMMNYKLGTLVRKLEIPAGTFHRAEEDSAYCGMVFARILDVLKARGESSTPEHIIRMIGKEELRFPQYEGSPDQLDLF